MQTDLRGRDLISLQEWTRRRSTPSSRSPSSSSASAPRDPPPAPAGQGPGDALLLLVHPHAGLVRGRHGPAGRPCQFIESRNHPDRHGDTPKEIGQILGRYNDGIAIRNVDWGAGNRTSGRSPRPAGCRSSNMQCDLFHPHQSLADLLHHEGEEGRPAGRTIAISWAYAASYQKPISVPVDLSLLTTALRMHVRLVHPPEFRASADQVAQAAENARRSAARSS